MEPPVEKFTFHLILNFMDDQPNKKYSYSYMRLEAFIMLKIKLKKTIIKYSLPYYATSSYSETVKIFASFNEDQDTVYPIVLVFI